MVVDLLAITNVCIEASEAQARLLESQNKGLSKKKQADREVNTVDHEDQGDRRDCSNHQQQPTDQKEKRLF
jgi:hypothetical protein